MARNTRSVTIDSSMADANGNIDAIIYADENVGEGAGQCRHGVVELNGERCNLNDPESV